MKKLSIILLGCAMAVMFATAAIADTATVSWNELTQNCNLTVANDIAGYIVKWGWSQLGPYPNEVVVGGSTTLQAVIDVGIIEDATAYFVVVGYDVTGFRSDDVGGCGASVEVAKYFDPLYPGIVQGVAVE